MDQISCDRCDLVFLDINFHNMYVIHVTRNNIVWPLYFNNLFIIQGKIFNISVYIHNFVLASPWLNSDQEKFCNGNFESSPCVMSLTP